MRRHLIPLLMILALTGCGSDGDEAGSTKGSSPTASESSPTTPESTSTANGAESATLSFDQVEGFTLAHLEGEGPVSEECDELGWVEDEAQKRELAPFTGTKAAEVLTCDDVPYLAYLEYEDPMAAQEGLAPALLPYLVAGKTNVVMPLIALDETTASAYLEALRSECSCGEVVQPGG